MIERGLGARVRAIGIVAAVVLGLAACIATPGKFTSTLDLRRDGSFAFSYEGEIYILALSQLAQMGGAMGSSGTFEPEQCYAEADMSARPCSEEELAEQRAAWDESQAERAANAEREAANMKQFMGGIDPSDPAAAEELAARLRSQHGWRRVDNKGDGLFDVSFAIDSRLTHDFVFPTFERFPLPSHFVTASRRNDGKVRIDAPGFAPQTGADSMGPMGGLASLAALGAVASQEAGGADTMPKLPQLDGTFRIVTDGQILSNNTEEGPVAGPGGQLLEWRITPRTTAAPMALIALDR
jgi:hypothetical protein